MVIITGAAGFIGSCLAKKMSELGFEVVLVDDFSQLDKAANLKAIGDALQVDRKVFFEWIEHQKNVEFIFHIGARTDTTEFDYHVLEKLNLEYTKAVWSYCTRSGVPLVYASSAATYGDGQLGYRDDHALVDQLVPLNPYGISKNEFDKWALAQQATPPHWYGLKFFNVYGPNEYHKGRMASVVLHAFRQIQSNGNMNLFRSHHPAFKDGEQMRDFVYVKDVLSVILFLHKTLPVSGLYNLGSGNARTFIDLAGAVFRALDLEPNIGFVDTPIDIRDKYQYFTQADMTKLAGVGYGSPFTSLENGVDDYVRNYLVTHSPF